MDAFLHNLDWVLPLRSPAATMIANAFTATGYLPFFLIFLSLGFWLNDRERFLRLTILLAVSAFLFAWLKDYWQDPRPDIHYALDPRVKNSYGRPSGHAATAVVLWGWLAYEVKRNWMWVIAVIMIVGCSLSRLYLGVHDVDDVLTGIAVGLAALFVFRWTLGSQLKPFRELPLWVHLVVLAALLPLLWPVWPAPALPPPYVTADVFLLAGALIGIAIDRRFAPGENVAKLSIARVIYAAFSVYALFQFIDLLGAFGKMLDANKLVWGWVTVTLLGLYITAAIPFAIRTLTGVTEKAMRRAQ